MNNWIAYYLLGPLEEKEATTGAILFCTGSLCDILARGFLEAEHKRKKKKKKRKKKKRSRKEKSGRGTKATTDAASDFTIAATASERTACPIPDCWLQIEIFPLTFSLSTQLNAQALGVAKER